MQGAVRDGGLGPQCIVFLVVQGWSFWCISSWKDIVSVRVKGIRLMLSKWREREHRFLTYFDGKYIYFMVGILFGLQFFSRMIEAE